MVQNDPIVISSFLSSIRTCDLPSWIRSLAPSAVLSPDLLLHRRFPLLVPPLPMPSAMRLPDFFGPRWMQIATRSLPGSRRYGDFGEARPEAPGAASALEAPHAAQPGDGPKAALDRAQSEGATDRS